VGGGGRWATTHTHDMRTTPKPTSTEVYSICAVPIECTGKGRGDFLHLKWRKECKKLTILMIHPCIVLSWQYKSKYIYIFNFTIFIKKLL